jgi:hypothetical protein
MHIAYSIEPVEQVSISEALYKVITALVVWFAGTDTTVTTKVLL